MLSTKSGKEANCQKCICIYLELIVVMTKLINSCFLVAQITLRKNAENKNPICNILKK
jgi:hypothetical protein